LVASVIELIGKWHGKSNEEVAKAVLDNKDEMSEFINRWTCAAMVMPRAVMPPVGDEPPRQLGENELLVTDLAIETRIAIMRDTFDLQAMVAAAAKAAKESARSFPQNGSGARSGSDVSTVPPAAVSGARHSRSGGRTRLRPGHGHRAP